MRKAAKVILAFLGASIPALVIAFTLAGVSQSGVMDVVITHVMFWLAFAISTVVAFCTAWLITDSLKRSLVALIVVAVIVGGGLLRLDGWLHEKKALQDAANQVPPPFRTSAPGPTVPIHKTPKVSRPIVKIEQHGSGNGAIGGSIIQGPCSIAQTGGSNNQATTNCEPPEPKINWELDSDPKRDKIRYGKKITWVAFSVDHTLEIPAFVAVCDRPCKTFSAGPYSGGFVNFSVASFSDPKLAGFVFSSPRPLGAGVKCYWIIESLDESPVQITSVQIIPKSLLP